MNTIVRAGLWMTGTIVSFSVMAVAGREISGTYDTFEIMLYRSIVGLIIVLVVAWRLGLLPEIKRTQLGLHLARNVAHFTGQNLWFFAVTVIPLAQVFALEFSSPIWVILLAPLLLGERLTATRVLAGLLGFAGVLIVTQPSIEGLSPGVLAAGTSAIFFALTNLLTRRLTWTQTTTCILFYLTAMQLVMGLLAAGWDGDIAPPDLSHAPWLLAIGLAGLMAHFCLTQALTIAPAIVVMPFDFVRLPTIAVIGAVFYAEALERHVIFGALVIFAAIYVNLWAEARGLER